MYFSSKSFYGIATRLKALAVISLTTFMCLLAIQVLQVTFAIEGTASWYGPNYAGKATANGEIYNPRELTAAHQSMAFNTVVRVTNLSNGQSVDVRINDRGPFIDNRIIDLSEAAAERIDMKYAGLAKVRLSIIKTGDAPLVINPVDTSNYAASKYTPNTLSKPSNTAAMDEVNPFPLASTIVNNTSNHSATNSTSYTSVDYLQNATTNYTSTLPLPFKNSTDYTMTDIPASSLNSPMTSDAYTALADIANSSFSSLQPSLAQYANYVTTTYGIPNPLASLNVGDTNPLSNLDNMISSRPYNTTKPLPFEPTEPSATLTSQDTNADTLYQATSTSQDTILNIKVMPGLTIQEVILEEYPIGAQLLLASATGNQVWVQVINNQLPPQITNTFLISQELSTLLGKDFKLLAQR